MKQSRLYLVLSFFILGAMMCGNGYAQSSSTNSPGKSDNDQVMKELLSEVRQLRVALQRVTANSILAQVTLERMRIQQQQVTQMIQELNQVRGQITETRYREAHLKDAIDDLEKRKSAGLGGDDEIKALKSTLEESKQREQTLVAREADLSVQSTIEQGKLDELNKRLDGLEQEVMTGAPDDVKQGSKKPNN
ncbi:MAG TPA: hypothetical protein VFC63_18435 [Blastocatellia bacterium]|nr:hypothetical protein [Blastocatellia bacterium]